jgi:hypothetical protein
LLEPIDHLAPSVAQILQRYEEAVDRMPGWFYAMTIYGEAVGAALERRLDIVREGLRDNPQPLVVAAPPGLAGAGAMLERVAEVLGCSAAPTEVAPGGEVLVVCWFRALSSPTRRYKVFLHLEGQGFPLRFLGDHDPAGGFLPTDRWRQGQIIRDALRLRVPDDAKEGRVQAFLGLFEGDSRVRASPAGLVDGGNRVRGPVFQVRRR